MDVKSVFLNISLEEEVYVKQPPGFIVKNQESKLYWLKKALYGLKQALRAWNKRIYGFIKEICFNKCVPEHGVYVKNDANEGMIILFLYVDDLLITDSNEGYISKFKGGLMKKFEMTDLGHMTYFFGIDFHKSKKGLLMHQRRYALEILKKKTEMEHRNISITHVFEPRMQLSKNEHEKDVNPTQYRRLIGSLCYVYENGFGF